MFANTEFTRKKMPVFTDSARYEDEPSDSVTCMRAYVYTDSDTPPKTLVAFDIFRVAEEAMAKKNWQWDGYDLDATLCLTPEDAIMLARTINRLISQIFREENYIRSET